jgi:hypothetical protein
MRDVVDPFLDYPFAVCLFAALVGRLSSFRQGRLHEARQLSKCPRKRLQRTRNPVTAGVARSGGLVIPLDRGVIRTAQWRNDYKDVSRCGRVRTTLGTSGPCV